MSRPKTRREIADELSIALTENKTALWQTQLIASYASLNASGVTEVAIGCGNDGIAGATPDQRLLPKPIGIWQPRHHGTGALWFERGADVGMDEARLWADVFGWPAQSAYQFRVALIGESVARGFMLDPAITPAKVLQQQLGVLMGEDVCEIIDLARTCLTNPIDLLTAALQLAPDVIVVFAGNNYLPAELTGADPDSPQGASLHQQCVSHLREEGVGGYIEARDDIVARKFFEPLLDSVSAIAGFNRIPLVFVLPEFNLVDWRDQPEFSAGVPNWLQSGELPDWLATMQEGERALTEGHIGKAGRLADKLVAMDGGLSMRSLRLQGLSFAQCGTLDVARQTLERARDLYGYCAEVPPCPRVHHRFQSLARERMCDGWCSLIDLSKILEDVFTALPNRESFFDYCHLTYDGLTAAMAPVAARVVTLLHGAEISDSERNLARKCRHAPSPPSAEVEGNAAFLAALHNAHWGQSPEIVNYWVRRALDVNPNVSEVMEAFLASRNTTLPGWMLYKTEPLFDPRGQLGRHLFGHEADLFDLALAQILADAMSTTTDPEAKAEKRDLGRFEVKSDRTIGIEQLLFTHLLAKSRHATNVLAVLWPLTCFTFISMGIKPLLLKLVIRLPSLRGGEHQSLHVSLNGEHLEECILASNWRSYELLLSALSLRSGANQIELSWPTEAPTDNRVLEICTRDLESGRSAWFRALFGEIHTSSCLSLVD